VTRLRKRKGRGAGGRRTVHLDDGILHPDAALLSHRGGGSVAAERGTAEHAAAPGDREARWKQGREAAAAGGVQGHQCFGRRRGAGEGSASHGGSGEEAAGQQQIAHPTCRARERASARVRAGEEEGGEEAKRGPALARGAWAWCGDWQSWLSRNRKGENVADPTVQAASSVALPLPAKTWCGSYCSSARGHRLLSSEFRRLAEQLFWIF